MRMHQRKRTKLKFAILISFLSTFRHSSLTIVQTILLEENRRRLSAPPCRTVGPKCSTYKTGVKREEPWDAPVRRPDRRPITRTQINGVAPSAAQPTLCSAEWPKATPIIIIIILLFQRSLHPALPPPSPRSDIGSAGGQSLPVPDRWSLRFVKRPITQPTPSHPCTCFSANDYACVNSRRSLKRSWNWWHFF